MPVTIVGNNTPTAGGVVYGDGTNYASTAAGTSGQVLVSNGSSAPSFGAASVAGGGTGQSSLTANNVLLGNGTSGVQFVAPGTNGNVLTSNGTTWASTAPAGGGALIYISTTTVSSAVAAIDITSGFSSTYDDYLLIGEDFTFSGSNGYTQFRLYTGGTLRTSSYNSNGIRWTSTTTNINNTAADHLPITATQDTNSSLSFVIHILNANSVDKRNSVLIQAYQGSSSTLYIQGTMSFGNYKGDTNAISGIRLLQLASGGDNFNTGTIKLYGIKKS